MNFDPSPATIAHIAGKITEINPILEFMQKIDDLQRARKRRMIFFYAKLIFLGFATIALTILELRFLHHH